MANYLARRALQSVVLLLMISVVLFLMMSNLGDPLSIFGESRQRPTGQALIELRKRLGLDEPVYLQYATWLIGNDWRNVDVRGDGTLMQPGTRKGILRGDLGMSFVTRDKASKRIEERLPNTLILMLPSYLLVLGLAVGIGIYSARHQYSFVDNLITGLSFFFYSLPIFVIALLCIYLFGLQFQKWGLPNLPIGGMYFVGRPRTLDALLVHMIMPVFCLVSIQLAGYVRFVRSSMLEVMNNDYIRTARAKGLAEPAIVRNHAFKNAALPLVTLIGLDLPFLLAGAVVTESIFAWPGMGRLFIESYNRLDFNVMMAILMLLCLAVVVVQLCTDVVYTWLDPRIRYS